MTSATGPGPRQRYGSGTSPLPEGTIRVGAGLLVLGVTSYFFLILAARALGPGRYSALAALWALVSVTGPGLFLPLEQEVSRALSARRVQGVAGGSVVRRAALAGIGLAMAVTVAAGAFRGPLTESLFDGHALLFVGFAASLFSYASSHLARGALAGSGRFGRYGLLLAAEGMVRAGGAVALVLLGVRTAGEFGLVLAFTPFVAVAVSLAGQGHLVAPGPDAQRSEVFGALGFLLAGSALAQLLVNAAPLTVKLFATDADEQLAGRFLAAVILARVPLFLFQAVQAALLPKLAWLAEAGQMRAFRTGLKQLVIVVLVVGAAATSAAWALGPAALRLAFGGAFDLARSHVTFLAAASAVYMLTQTLAQALIALGGHRRAAWAWLSGVVAYVVLTAPRPDSLLGVEIAFLGSCGMSALGMGGLLALQLATRSSERPAPPVQLTPSDVVTTEP